MPNTHKAMSLNPNMAKIGHGDMSVILALQRLRSGVLGHLELFINFKVMKIQWTMKIQSLKMDKEEVTQYKSKGKNVGQCQIVLGLIPQHHPKKKKKKKRLTLAVS